AFAIQGEGHRPADPGIAKKRVALIPSDVEKELGRILVDLETTLELSTGRGSGPFGRRNRSPVGFSRKEGLELRGGRRDDLEDQLIQVGPPEEVVAVRFQNDLPAALPTRETEGTGPDGTARRIFRARGHRLEQMLRHQGPLPGIQRQ